MCLPGGDHFAKKQGHRSIVSLRNARLIKRPPQQENWNIATHAIGAAVSLVAGCWLVLSIRDTITTAVFVSVVVYLLSLVAMYTMSALSHAFDGGPQQERFRSLDQGCIFTLIVGTYTPISVHFWNTAPANILLGLMWLIAISGFVLKVFARHRVNRVSVWLYVAMGWMPAVGWLFHEHKPHDCATWILAGGLIYSAGVGFLLSDQKANWLHPAWHLMVMLASAVHFVAIARFVALVE